MSSRPARSAPADPLTLEVVELIGSVVVRYHQEYDEAAARHSLTGTQARLLALLHHRPLPMREIARRLKCEPSNVTGIVDRLESRGLVERHPDPADRRVKLAAVTDEGRATAGRLRASLHFAREPLAELTPVERALLRDLLKRMLGDERPEAAEDGRERGRTAPGTPEPGHARHQQDSVRCTTTGSVRRGEAAPPSAGEDRPAGRRVSSAAAPDPPADGEARGPEAM